MSNGGESESGQAVTAGNVEQSLGRFQRRAFRFNDRLTGSCEASSNGAGKKHGGLPPT